MLKKIIECLVCGVIFFLVEFFIKHTELVHAIIYSAVFAVALFIFMLIFKKFSNKE